ncbi:magnesium-translocating P-type ATPase [Robinsoniella peoriensis]|uniref:magnesium-translocating P-type ATPase n=1 Tax=Robinsoniella peoriensis TaxID=180332 RepID=UPI00085BD9A2|nr:magnesium-translocating P-type ATPase [Robinsoniella peoriensis]
MKKNRMRNMVRRETVNEKLKYAATVEWNKFYEEFQTSSEGMTNAQLEVSEEEYGKNIVTHGQKESLVKRICGAFINPFTAILFVLAAVSVFTDIIFADPGEQNPVTVIIITTMVMISGMLRFIQETRSGNAAARLSAMIRTTTCVKRMEEGTREILLEDVAVGDVVMLSAGDMIPADIRIISAKDLFISQSALTGESEPVEKCSALIGSKDAVTDYSNLAFMGSNVISGSAAGVVIAVGNNTMLGEMAKSLSEKPDQTSFEKGVNSVSWVLIRFMLIMVPVVFFINGYTKNDWMDAALFAISVAVGLTPEMLPMIVTTCLAKGAVSMSRQKVIIKNLNAIQNLGSIDILCTDKTGTLTRDKVVLEYHLDIEGNEDPRVLRHGFLNSYYQTGLKNLMDIAIIDRTNELQEQEVQLQGIQSNYEKVDEIPFDFERRRMSVVVADKNGKTQMITKGAVEEMLRVCAFAEYEGKVEPLTDQMRNKILTKVEELNESGMRVIAVAQKTNPSPEGAFSVADEADMVLIGYLAFLDPPKETAAAAIKALHGYGVNVKVLTGDNEKVTCCICKQVGLSTKYLLLGTQVDAMDDDQLAKEAEKTTVFAKLSPAQKARVVKILQKNGHVVGYMGDGINDAAAMKASDVGISVDTAVDIAKESADTILLEKDLMVLEKGILEGRKTYANMIKYIKMTASSNFGNMFSVLAASAFLPFLPMTAIHLILLNLIYDISCTAIPWDNVDIEFLAVPKKWDASSVSKFMLLIGPTSSIFDIATYLVMYFVICPLMSGGLLYHQISDPQMQDAFVAVFQAGWFIESMWSQTLVIHMIRTAKVPFIQSHAAAPVTILTLGGILTATIIPFTGLGSAIGLAALPAVYFAILAAVIVCYMGVATFMKKMYVRRYGELL